MPKLSGKDAKYTLSMICSLTFDNQTDSFNFFEVSVAKI